MNKFLDIIVEFPITWQSQKVTIVMRSMEDIEHRPFQHCKCKCNALPNYAHACVTWWKDVSYFENKWITS
jgi:hypothetical protein